VRLKFEPAAADAYENIADDEVLNRLDMVFDELEKNPGRAWLRRHRWSDPPLRGVAVRGRGEDLLVLWAAEPYGDEAVIVVRYLGRPPWASCQRPLAG
jgi:hypothetical protein